MPSQILPVTVHYAIATVMLRSTPPLQVYHNYLQKLSLILYNNNFILKLS